MMKAIISLFCSVLLAFSAFHTTGCVAVVAGGAVGGTAYLLGDLTVELETTPKHLREAVLGAGEELGLRKESGSGDELAGKYVFRNAKDEKITVSYEAQTASFITMKIRVGTFGDEAQSLRISDAIKQQL